MSKINATELVLLKEIWKSGQLSAKELQDACGEGLGWSYSSTRTTLRRMVEKDILFIEKVHGIATYKPSQSKVKTMASLMQDFMSRVLEVKGSIPTSAFHDSNVLSDDELQELKAILDKNLSDSSK